VLLSGEKKLVLEYIFMQLFALKKKKGSLPSRSAVEAM
jgi:hypothetical protein